MKFLQYDYPKPQDYRPSSFNRESSYQYHQTQEDINGYQYNKPEMIFSQTGSRPLTVGQQSRDQYKSVISNQQRISDLQLGQTVPNEYANEFAFPITQNAGASLLTRTTGDDQGAFINSNIFGPDFDSQNFTLSPTGRLIPIVGAIFPSVGISCNEPYQPPRMPDFRYPGLRISDISK